MADVLFNPARIIANTAIANYSAQDLETQDIGVAVPFTWDFQSGDTYLDLDSITFTPVTFNDYGYQDFELLQSGSITTYQGINVNSTNAVEPLLTATITPQVFSVGSDDLESYFQGLILPLPIIQLTAFSESGDITMFVGAIRPYP